MTAAAASALPAELEQMFTAWSESFSQVLAQISGTPQPCTVLTEAPADFPAAAAGDLWAVCACSGGLRGELSLHIPAAAADRLARIFMGEPAAPASETGVTEVSAEYREAAVELLRQVAGLVVSQLKPRWGEVQLRPELGPGPPTWAAATTAWLRAGADEAVLAVVEIQLSAALVAELRTEKTESAQSPTATGAATSPPVPSATVGDNVKLDLLMDVELALTLRFGSRRLPLSEILDLNPGAVIGLDRQVQEPVDVLLDGRIVARGEVVVIEGHYGLKVTEVGPGGGV